MTDFVQELSQKLGTDSGPAGLAAGTVLNAVRQAAPADVFDSVTSAVPEAGDLVGKAQPDASATKSGAPAALGVLAGGGAASLPSLLAQLGRLDLGSGSAAEVVPTVVAMLKDRMGSEAFDKLAASVPFVGDVMKMGAGVGVVGKLFGR